MEYCEGKHNPADELFRRPDYMDEEDKPLYIVGYVTWLLNKHNLAQRKSEEGGQAPKEPEVNSEPVTAESQLKSINPHEANIDGNLTDLENELITRAHLLGSSKPNLLQAKSGVQRNG